MKQPNSALVLALCVAPIAGAALGFLCNGLIGRLLGEFAGAPNSALGWIAGAMLFVLGSLYWGGLLGMPAVFLVGLPLHALLHRCGLRALPWYATLGPIVGLGIYLLGVAALQAWAPIGNPEVLYETHSIRGTLLIAFATSIVFWLIRRPDRDARSNPPTSSS